LTEWRVLATFVAVSLAAHAAVLFLLPELKARDTARVEILEVTLAQPIPPRVLEPTPARVPDPPRPELKKRERPPAVARSEPVTAPPAESPRELLAMPAKSAELETASPLPQPATEAPAAEKGPRRDAAKGAAGTEAASIEPKTTPPSFNAAYLKNPPPRYPMSARRNGEQGTVTLRVLVTREGLPANVSVQTTSGSTGLDQAAIEAVRGWRFAPARQGAQAVEAWVLVPIVFRLEG
jgi:protein TonB